MATLKPRVAVTLEPHRYDMLKRLASLQGVSMSHLLADLVETVAEPLERVVVVLEAAKRAPDQVKDGLRAAVLKSEAEVLPMATKALSQLDMFLAEAAAAVGGDGRRSRAAPSSVADPRPVTRGSTPPSPPPSPAVKKPRKASSSKASIKKRG